MEKFETLWKYLPSFPEGDTPFPGWIMPRLRATFALPGMTKVGAGNIELAYDGMPTYEYRGDRELVIPPVLLGYFDQAEAAKPILDAMIERHGTAKPYQANIIDPFDHAFFALGAEGITRHYESFRAPALAEISAIHALFGGDVVFQLESPARMVALESIASDSERAARAAEMGSDIAEFVRRMPEGAQVTMHICRGDWEHTTWSKRIDGYEPLVLLANEIVAAWPSGRVLRGIHIPLAGADVLPIADEADAEIYRPLEQLTTEVPVYAGIVHEQATPERILTALAHARRYYPQPFGGLGTSCGMARMSEPEMDRALGLLAELAARVGTAEPAALPG
ncbi:hypothetical protein BJY24_007281 [Nocardia transvalensis]|uniref:5-methyltetrahydropteroyltriglutamate--homocysteine methyltransferase n=1 Tax=Nocardia transvalensis TaxID=37333 RepID=A0A7W9PLH8_9NOCA|nr:hypothetical protein [Nocardia transvalensis]MBB5918369.1 hypothetical protein [Nocardia transvalensis]